MMRSSTSNKGPRGSILVLAIIKLSFLCLVFSAPANAALVSQDHANWGAGSITLDTDTGLQWLDVDRSVNYSYNSMQAALGDGGSYAGFRYASQSEVEALFINGGVPDVNSGSAANVDPALELLALLGATYDFRGNEELFGITGTASAGGMASGTIDHFLSSGIDSYSVTTLGAVYGLNYSADSIGNWLVVDTAAIPVPPAFLLFSSALGVLACLRRRSRYQPKSSLKI